MNSKVVLGAPKRQTGKCGFGMQPGANGPCKECGEPAEPGAKRLCINCEIEQGASPVKTVEPEKADKSSE